MEREQPKNSAGEGTPEQSQQAESGGDPTQDYAGYASLDEWRKATYESRKEGKRLAETNAQLTAYLSRMLKVDATEAKEAADELGELGIPTATLKQAIREVVAEEMAPGARTQEALINVRMSNPDFAKSEADFHRWCHANPDVVNTFNKAVAKSPEAAEFILKGVFAEYQTSRRPDPAAEPKKVAPGAKIPPSRGGGGSASRAPADKVSREEMQELVKNARRTGNPVELMKAILGDRPIHRSLARREVSQ